MGQRDQMNPSNYFLPEQPNEADLSCWSPILAAFALR